MERGSEQSMPYERRVARSPFHNHKPNVYHFCHPIQYVLPYLWPDTLIDTPQSMLMLQRRSMKVVQAGCRKVSIWVHEGVNGNLSSP